MEANRLLNEELLEQYVRAGSADSCAEELRILAEHVCDKIRLRVAENPNTPTAVLSELSKDSNHDVRIAVAANQSCEPSVRETLARDSDVVVRHGLAQNIDTPKNLLDELVNDDNGWVRGEALKTLQILASRGADEMAERRAMRRPGLESVKASVSRAS